jgi:hypothetical protein
MYPKQELENEKQPNKQTNKQKPFPMILAAPQISF